MQAGEDVLGERSPAGPGGAGRAKDPVQQLAHGDDADGTVLVAEEVVVPASLGVDQQVGVDQEGHGSPGGPALSRSSRRSAANSSSGRGAVAMSSRKRCADTKRAPGGAITATGAPLRVTSIASPQRRG